MLREASTQRAHVSARRCCQDLHLRPSRAILSLCCVPRKHNGRLAAAFRAAPKLERALQIPVKASASLQQPEKPAQEAVVPAAELDLSDVAVWVRKLPWSLPRDELRRQLHLAAPRALMVEVAGSKGKGSAAGADHKGHALLLFETADEAEQAMHAMEGLHMGECSTS
jgi:hypothetical protein